MIDHTHTLPVSQQARLVGIARSSVYYRARPLGEVDLLLMRRIDELHLAFPFAGARMAITLEATHAVEALEEAFARYGRPDIVNTDQGSQFTASTFTEAVLGRGIRLSMDGKGSWRDNVFVERVWRSIKYEEVYLKAYESVSHARRSIGEYIELYNCKRPHSSLSGQTPDEAYFATLPAIKLAA